MKPLNLIASSPQAFGGEIRLLERDGTYHLEQGTEALDTSRARLPVQRMVQMACHPFKGARQPRILIDGLNLGQVLHEVQTALPQKGAELVLAEPKVDLPSWHRGPLADLYPGLLDDERIQHQVISADEVAANESKSLNLILVSCLGIASEAANHPILTKKGMNLASGALKDGGLLAVVSDTRDDGFGKLLAKHGFQVVEEYSPPSENSKSKRLHPIWLARKGFYVSQNRQRSRH